MKRRNRSTYRTWGKEKAPHKRRSLRGLRPAASRLLICGEMWILAAVCDFAARLDVASAAGTVGLIHRLSDFGGSLSAAAVILVAASLGLDYLERTTH